MPHHVVVTIKTKLKARKAGKCAHTSGTCAFFFYRTGAARCDHEARARKLRGTAVAMHTLFGAQRGVRVVSLAVRIVLWHCMKL